MPLLLLAYLAFLGISLPDGLLGASWPSMSVSFSQPIGALGLVLPIAVVSSMVSAASTGALLSRFGLGRILAASVAAYTVALVAESLAPSFWVFVAAVVLLAAGSGAIDVGLNSYAAREFNARQITWMHAVYGLGAAAGPLLFLATVTLDLSWRWAFGAVAVLLTVLTIIFTSTTRRWPRELPPVEPRRAATKWTIALRQSPAGLWLGGVAFLVQTGLETGSALWAFTYLTQARAVPLELAAAATSGYWIALLISRLVLGAVANRTGARPIILAGLAGMGVGAVLLVLPGLSPIVGFLLLGFSAAPMFPLLTLTTKDRVGAVWTDRAIGVQSAASTAGSAALPAAIGLLIAPFGPEVIGPSLLVLAGVSIAVVGLAVLPRDLRRYRVGGRRQETRP
jgi:MFS family permease